MVRRALAGQSTHAEHSAVLRPNGSTFEADLRVMPSYRGRPHALAVLRDISERRQRERELQHSEEQYRAIFNASVDATVLRSADFSIVDVNAIYEAWTGYSRAEVIGVNCVVANPQEVKAVIRRAVHGEALGVPPCTWRRNCCGATATAANWELRGVPILHRGSRTCCTSAATSPRPSSPNGPSGTARSSTAPSSTPRPTRWCCATPTTAPPWE